MDEITLSSTEFRALSSETRTGIVKMLNERKYTLSEISKKMELAAPTVKQHLSVLEQAGLIQCIDEGRKWKYYVLTKKGRNIIQPESQGNVLIVLGLSIIGMAAVLYSLLGKVAMYAAVEQDNVLAAVGETAAKDTAPRAAETLQGVLPINGVGPMLIIAVVFAALIVIFLQKLARKK